MAIARIIPSDTAVTFLIPPLAFRADEAARYIGATTFFVEQLLRSGELPFVTIGKRRVIYLNDLKFWFENERTKQLVDATKSSSLFRIHLGGAA